MKTATISQTKNQLSALLDLVRHGETILIVDRDLPIARIEPVLASDPHSRLARLERTGFVRRGSGKAAASILTTRPPRPRDGADILKALLDEREEGR